MKSQDITWMGKRMVVAILRKRWEYFLYHMHKGQQNGTADSLSIEGKLVDEVLTDFGQITKEIEYDTKGHVRCFWRHCC